MSSSLASGEIDLAIGLTEGWVTGLAKASSENRSAGYKLVATYVESPLCWAISTGAARKDVAQERDPGEWPKGLKGTRMGVSRVGSGSYVMGFVLADLMGWMSGSSSAPKENYGDGAGAGDSGCGGDSGKKEPFEIVPLQTFEKLREGVNDGTADFFLWEHFTSKRYYENGKIRRIGEILTPWPSWHIVARDEILRDEDGSRLEEVFEAVNLGVKYFEEHREEAARFISTEMDYSEEDAKEWMKTVQFAKSVKGVKRNVVDQTLEVLKKAGVVEKDATGDGMIEIPRRE